ncbi:MAG: cupin domain-containing protein [Hyphomicrobiales bacterium]
MNQTRQSPVISSGKLVSLGSAAFSGISVEILLGGEDGPLTVLDMTIAPGSGAPEHISFGEDKVFQILEGRLVFLIDLEKITLKAGECVFVARGITHSFAALDGALARMTLISTPARHDRFFQAMGELSVPHRMNDVQSICSDFEQAIVGPVVTLDA